MTITTRKSTGDAAFFFNEMELAINEGKVENIHIEVGTRLMPTTIPSTTPTQTIRYGIRTTTGFYAQKEEKDVYDTAEALLEVIKDNSGIV